MKHLIPLLISFLLIGCATSYNEPTTGDLAFADMGQGDFGADASALAVDISNISCEHLSSGQGSRLKSTKQVIIPAEKPLYVAIDKTALDGIKIIGGYGLFTRADKVYFTPKKGKYYVVTLTRYLEKERYSSILVREYDSVTYSYDKPTPSGKSKIIPIFRCGQEGPAYNLDNINHNAR